MRRELGIYTVKPGITGLAQICGRDKLSDIRKAECDMIYVNNISLAFDFRILIETIFGVIKKEGIM